MNRITPHQPASLRTGRITDNVPQDETRTFPVGKGFLTISRIDPKEIVMERPQPVNPETLITSLMEKMKAAKSAPPDWNYTPKNHFHLQRGAFDVVAVLDESASGLPYRVEAPGIDLFDPTLPVRDGKVLQPDERALLLNLNRIAKDHPLCWHPPPAPRMKHPADSYSFTMKSPPAPVSCTTGCPGNQRISKPPCQIKLMSNSRVNGTRNQYAPPPVSKSS